MAQRSARPWVRGVTVNGVGGDITSSAAIDPEFKPTALDPRYTERQANSPMHRNVIKDRPATAANARRARTHVDRSVRTGRDERGRFVKQPRKLTVDEIRKRGMYGY